MARPALVDRARAFGACSSGLQTALEDVEVITPKVLESSYFLLQLGTSLRYVRRLEQLTYKYDFTMVEMQTELLSGNIFQAHRANRRGASGAAFNRSNVGSPSAPRLA
jgi:hypothetical protein